MTQNKRVLDWLMENGSISTMEAFEQLGITRLSSRIFDLRASGITISGKMVKGKNRYGDDVHYMRYSLEGTV